MKSRVFSVLMVAFPVLLNAQVQKGTQYLQLNTNIGVPFLDPISPSKLYGITKDSVVIGDHTAFNWALTFQHAFSPKWSLGLGFCSYNPYSSDDRVNGALGGKAFAKRYFDFSPLHDYPHFFFQIEYGLGRAFTEWGHVTMHQCGLLVGQTLRRTTGMTPKSELEVERYFSTKRIRNHWSRCGFEWSIGMDAAWGRTGGMSFVPQGNIGFLYFLDFKSWQKIPVHCKVKY